MDSQYTHRFIVRLRFEPRENEGESREWRGHIDHIEGGERLYFRNLDDIIHFIQGFLQKTECLAPGAAENESDLAGEEIDFSSTPPNVEGT
jgi:hypothetical protein